MAVASITTLTVRALPCLLKATADDIDVGDPRDYKWTNTVPLAKSMHHFHLSTYKAIC